MSCDLPTMTFKHYNPYRHVWCYLHDHPFPSHHHHHQCSTTLVVLSTMLKPSRRHPYKQGVCNEKFLWRRLDPYNWFVPLTWSAQLPHANFNTLMHTDHVNNNPILSTTVYIMSVLFWSAIFTLIAILGNVHRPHEQCTNIVNNSV